MQTSSKPESLNDLLRQLEEADAVLADGFDDALIGIAHRASKPSVAIYERAKCLTILMEQDGMSYERAVEFFEFNVVGAWAGPGTPVFADLL